MAPKKLWSECHRHHFRIWPIGHVEKKWIIQTLYPHKIHSHLNWFTFHVVQSLSFPKNASASAKASSKLIPQFCEAAGWKIAGMEEVWRVTPTPTCKSGSGRVAYIYGYRWIPAPIKTCIKKLLRAELCSNSQLQHTCSVWTFSLRYGI